MRYMQLVYKSIATPGLTGDDVLRILRSAQERNLSERISGLLIFRDGVFFQLIEGYEPQVIDLFDRIMVDPRHTAIDVIEECHSDKVAMPAWAMSYFAPSTIDAQAKQHQFVISEKHARLIFSAFPRSLATPFLDFFRQ